MNGGESMLKKNLELIIKKQYKKIMARYKGQVLDIPKRPFYNKDSGRSRCLILDGHPPRRFRYPSRNAADLLPDLEIPAAGEQEPKPVPPLIPGRSLSRSLSRTARIRRSRGAARHCRPFPCRKISGNLSQTKKRSAGVSGDRF